MHRIEIDLKPGSYAYKDQLPANEYLNDLLQNEYATRYLESIGAAPSRENIEQVLEHFPLGDIAVMPVWIREKILIVPGLKSSEITGDTTALVQELYRREKLSSKFNTKITGKAKLGYTSNRQKKEKGVDNGENIHDKSLNNDNKYDKNERCKMNVKTPRRKVEEYNDTGATLESSICNAYDYLSRCDKYLLSKISEKGLEKMLVPPNMREDEDVINAVANFSSVLTEFVPSVRRGRDPTGRLRSDIQELLRSPTSIGLFALLAHHCYWTIVHPMVRKIVLRGRENNENANALYHLENDIMMNMEGISTSVSSINHDQHIHEEDQSFAAAIHFANTFNPTQPDGTNSTNDSCRPFPGIKNPYNLSQSYSIGYSAGVSGASTPFHASTATSVCSLPSLTRSVTSLTQNEEERLFLQVQACIAELHSVMGLDTFFVMSAHHALVSCCYYTVDAILSKMYSWLNEEIDNISVKHFEEDESEYDSHPATDYTDDDWEEWESDENSNSINGRDRRRGRGGGHDSMNDDDEEEEDDEEEDEHSRERERMGEKDDTSKMREKRSRRGRRRSSNFSRNTNTTHNTNNTNTHTARRDRTDRTNAQQTLDLRHLSHILRTAIHSLMHKSIAKIVDPSGLFSSASAATGAADNALFPNNRHKPMKSVCAKGLDFHQSKGRFQTTSSAVQAIFSPENKVITPVGRGSSRGEDGVTRQRPSSSSSYKASGGTGEKGLGSETGGLGGMGMGLGSKSMDDPPGPHTGNGVFPVRGVRDRDMVRVCTYGRGGLEFGAPSSHVDVFNGVLKCALNGGMGGIGAGGMGGGVGCCGVGVVGGMGGGASVGGMSGGVGAFGMPISNHVGFSNGVPSAVACTQSSNVSSLKFSEATVKRLPHSGQYAYPPLPSLGPIFVDNSPHPVYADRQQKLQLNLTTAKASPNSQFLLKKHGVPAVISTIVPLYIEQPKTPTLNYHAASAPSSSSKLSETFQRSLLERSGLDAREGRERQDGRDEKDDITSPDNRQRKDNNNSIQSDRSKSAYTVHSVETDNPKNNPKSADKNDKADKNCDKIHDKNPNISTYRKKEDPLTPGKVPLALRISIAKYKGKKEGEQGDFKSMFMKFPPGGGVLQSSQGYQSTRKMSHSPYKGGGDRGGRGEGGERGAGGERGEMGGRVGYESGGSRMDGYGGVNNISNIMNKSNQNAQSHSSILYIPRSGPDKSIDRGNGIGIGSSSFDSWNNNSNNNNSSNNNNHPPQSPQSLLCIPFDAHDMTLQENDDEDDDASALFSVSPSHQPIPPSYSKVPYKGPPTLSLDGKAALLEIVVNRTVARYEQKTIALVQLYGRAANVKGRKALIKK